jgi:hypothetical protein
MRPNPKVVAQVVGKEVVLVHMGTNRIFSLNTTGAALWELLTAGRDVAEMRASLLERFDVEPAQLDREIGALLESLKREDLVLP